jgi:hypothetical protein
MLPKVPTEVNQFVEKVLDKINAEFDPEFVPVIPESYAKPENCFGNVDEKVKRDGGKVHYGWAIFQSSIICEAERHAVWENENEELIDITPREFGFEKIMFVSDNNLVYRGQLIDNARINITNNKLVDDYIKLCETLEFLYTYGTRLNDDMLNVPEPALTLTFQYQNLKNMFQAYLYQGGTEQTPCLCGSGAKYKKCHGKNLRVNFQNDLSKVSKVLKERPLA